MWFLWIQDQVVQSCPTLCDPMDCSLPGSSVHGIFQATVLEWIAISFSRGSSQPRDQTLVSCIVDRHFTVWTTREIPMLFITTILSLLTGFIFPRLTDIYHFCLRFSKILVFLILLSGKAYGRRSLVGCSPWGREESDTTERLHFHFLTCKQTTMLPKHILTFGKS